MRMTGKEYNQERWRQYGLSGTCRFASIGLNGAYRLSTVKDSTKVKVAEAQRLLSELSHELMEVRTLEEIKEGKNK